MGSRPSDTLLLSDRSFCRTLNGIRSGAIGPDIKQAAERLGFALDSSARLALMDALSHAAAEITTNLDGRSVEVRLEGREPVFVVRGAGLPRKLATPPPSPPTAR